MAKQCRPSSLNSSIKRTTSISTESVDSASASASSAATLIMSLNGEEREVMSMGDNQRRALKRRRMRMNSDATSRMNRSISSTPDRKISSNYNRFKSSTRYRDDLDLLRSCTNSSSGSSKSCLSGDSIKNAHSNQVAVLIHKNSKQQNNVSTLLRCLDIAKASMLHPQTNTKGQVYLGNIHDIDSFGAILDLSNTNNSFMHPSLLKFQPPIVTLKELRSQLSNQTSDKPKTNIEEHRNADKTSSEQFLKIYETVQYLCNSLPWNSNLAADQKNMTKSIYVILTDPNLCEILVSTPSLTKSIQTLKMHLLEQPAGGISLHFINPSLDDGFFPSAKMKPSQGLFTPSFCCFPTLKLRDFYKFSSQYLSDSKNDFPPTIKDDQTYLSHITSDSTKIDFSGAVENESQRKLNHFVCSCSCTLLHGPTSGNVGVNLPDCLESPKLLKISDIVVENLAPKFSYLLSVKEDETADQQTFDHLRSFHNLITFLRLKNSVVLFSRKEHKEHDQSTFVMRPLSPYTALLENVPSHQFSLNKNIPQPLLYHEVKVFVDNATVEMLRTIPVLNKIDTNVQKLWFAMSIVLLDLNKEIDPRTHREATTKVKNTNQEKSVKANIDGNGDELAGANVDKNSSIPITASSCISFTKNETCNITSEEATNASSHHHEKNSMIAKINNTSGKMHSNHSVYRSSSMDEATSQTVMPKQRSESNMSLETNRISDLYSACVNESNPTPKALVLNEMLPQNLLTSCAKAPFAKTGDGMNLLRINNSNNIALKISLKFCISTANIARVSMEDDDTEKERKLRIIQIQILIRLQLAVATGQFFLDVKKEGEKNMKPNNSVNKKQKKKKNKSKSKQGKSVNIEDFIEYIESLLSLVRFALPPTIIFSSFFEENIVTPFFHPLPHIVGELSNSFDISIASSSHDKVAFASTEKTIRMNSSSKITRRNSRSNNFSFLSSVADEATNSKSNHEMQLKKDSQAMNESLEMTPSDTMSRSISTGVSVTMSSASKKQEKNQMLLKRSGSLKRKNKSKNPLLADGKVRYIGSHFNGKLSNSSFLREVKLVRRYSSRIPETTNSKNLTSMHSKIQKNIPTKSINSNTQPGSNKLISPLKVLLPKPRIISETPQRKIKPRKTASSFMNSYKTPEKAQKPAAKLVLEAAVAARKQKSNIRKGRKN